MLRFVAVLDETSTCFILPQDCFNITHAEVIRWNRRKFNRAASGLSQNESHPRIGRRLAPTILL